MSDENVSKKHPHKVLTAAFVRNVVEPDRYGDGDCLFLDVDASGRKSWLLRVTVHGKRRDIGLGSARTVGLADARLEAARMRNVARAGGDPLIERQKQREDSDRIRTFKEAALEVYNAHVETFRSDRHARQWIQSMEDYVFPHIGARRVDHVDSGDVLRVLSPIWLKKPETASRVHQRMVRVFKYAKAARYSNENPAEDIDQVLPDHKREGKHFAALNYSELPAFLQKLRSYEGVPVRLAFEFLILCASRSAEILRAKWNEIDMSSKTWTIPAERMKGKIEHRVPLSVRALEILEESKKLSDGGPWVFPGNRYRHPLGSNAFDFTLGAMDYAHITAHGFRSSFRDWAEERTSFRNRVIEQALAHKLRDKTERAYQRSDLFEDRVKLMEAWAQFATAPAGQVVRFRA